jgi:hypothetical protein
MDIQLVYFKEEVVKNTTLKKKRGPMLVSVPNQQEKNRRE